MIRLLAIGFLAIAAFAGTVAGFLAINGQLSAVNMNRLLGRDAAQEGDIPAEEDPVGPWAARLKEEEELLSAREAELEEWESRLAQREQDLAQVLTDITQRQEQVQVSLDRLDTDRASRLKEVAASFENMQETAAAESMEKFPPEEAAEIIQLIKAKDRGSILDAMDPDKRTLILQIMQERSY